MRPVASKLVCAGLDETRSTATCSRPLAELAHDLEKSDEVLMIVQSSKGSGTQNIEVVRAAEATRIRDIASRIVNLYASSLGKTECKALVLLGEVDHRHRGPEPCKRYREAAVGSPAHCRRACLRRFRGREESGAARPCGSATILAASSSMLPKDRQPRIKAPSIPSPSVRLGYAVRIIVRHEHILPRALMSAIGAERTRALRPTLWHVRVYPVATSLPWGTPVTSRWVLARRDLGSHQSQNPNVTPWSRRRRAAFGPKRTLAKISGASRAAKVFSSFSFFSSLWRRNIDCGITLSAATPPS